MKEFEETEYEKLATTFYVKNPGQIAFETKWFEIKPKLKIGNKKTDDITREDYNKKILKYNMIDCNSFK